jgi:prepilin-type processing-associated H-X9-DG protein
MPASTGKMGQDMCLSNLKALALAQMLYAADRGGPFPMPARWNVAVAPYLEGNDLELYRCPQDTRSNPQQYDYIPTSYTMNVACGGVTAAMNGGGQVPLLWDGTEMQGKTSTATQRHGEGLNVAYADGHCSWLSMSEFSRADLVPGSALGPQPAQAWREKLAAAHYAVESHIPPRPAPGRYTKDNCWSGLDITGKRDYNTGGPGGRYSVYNRDIPSASSNLISASLVIEAPEEVWLGAKFTAHAHGSYRLDPALAAQVHSGQAQIQERYFWDIDPAECANSQEELRSSQVACWYSPNGHFSKEHPTGGLWATYAVGVFLPDGTVEWARAETHRTPTVKRLHVQIREPLSEGQAAGRRYYYPWLQGAPHQPYRFAAAAELLPGHLPVEGVRYEWDFDDGSVVKGNSVEHTFSQAMCYQVVLRAYFQEQVAMSTFQATMRDQANPNPPSTDDLQTRNDNFVSLGEVSFPVDPKRRGDNVPRKPYQP